jgi:muramidase (phage lysozyme)
MEARMSPDVPPGAAVLLDFIAEPESRGRYDVIYGNHENTLAQPLTSMTITALLSAQILWGRRWGSSAAGRYQIMQTTLAGLHRAGVVAGDDLFSPDNQDRLGYALLKQRGYAGFMARTLPLQTFALHLAQEWASMPVLVACKGAHREVQAGETYYAGDRLNKALVTPAQFEAALTRAHAKAA